MTLLIAPAVSDPEGDPVTVEIAVDGRAIATTDGSGGNASRRIFDVDDVGYSHLAEVSLTATDDHGNETVEVLQHPVEHERSVKVTDFTFKATGATCFDDRTELRFGAEFSFVGPATWESDWVLDIQPATGQIVVGQRNGPAAVIRGTMTGRPVAQQVEVRVVVEGESDTHTSSHTSSDQVLTNLLRSSDCRLQMTYTIEIEDR